MTGHSLNGDNPLHAEGIIFDLDGTLLHTLNDLTDAVNVGLKAFDLPPAPADRVRDWIGEGLPTLCRRAAGDTAAVPIDLMAEIVTRHYREHRLDRTAPYPGIPDLLDALTHRGIPMAVLSNKPHEHTLPMCKALLGRWSFAAIAGYQKEDHRKPDPRITLEIIGTMGLDPPHVALVGDSGTDVQTARNAGVIPIAATWGYRSRQHLIDAGAEFLIDEPLELLDLLS